MHQLDMCSWCCADCEQLSSNNTLFSPDKDTGHEDILDVRTMQLGLITALFPLNQDN